MNKLYILLLIVMFSCPYYLGENNKDSINISTNRINELQVKVDRLSSEVERVKDKQQFFSDSLSEQTGVFSLIVLLIISSLSFITFRSYKNKIKKLGKDMDGKINVLEKVFDKTKGEIQSLKSDVYLALANEYRLSAIHYRQDNINLNAAVCFFYSLYYGVMLNELTDIKQRKNKTLPILFMQATEESLTSYQPNNEELQSLKEAKERLLKMISELEKISTYEGLLGFCARFKVKIYDLAIVETT